MKRIRVFYTDSSKGGAERVNKFLASQVIVKQTLTASGPHGHYVTVVYVDVSK